nr:hypothetical protein [Deltaproteobacteria bacterium]
HLPLKAPGGLAEAVGKPVGLEARDLVFHAQGAEIRVSYLSGTLVPAKGGDLVDLEVPSSFEVEIDALEVRISEQSLQGGMTGGDKPPFRDLTVRMDGDSILLDGHAAMMNLPFSFRANPRVTERGALVLELEKARVLGIGVRNFIGAFQKRIESAANKKGHLLDIDQDRLRINPFPFIGPPAIEAKFSSVEVHEHELVARLGELTALEEEKGEPGLVLTGGAIRTGSTVLLGVTLSLRAEHGGPLQIDPERMEQQIEQGYMKQSGRYTTLYLVAPDALKRDPAVSSSAPPGGTDAGNQPGKAPSASETTPAPDR